MAMKLHRVYGHDALINRLGATIASGRFPQGALFTGPAKVGKQRVALWAAQRLLCSSPDGAAPCGACQSCAQVQRLVHPDLHWFIPVVPKRSSSDPEKQVQEVEEGIAASIGERRENPLYGPLDAKASHSMASIRLLQRRVALRPFQGRRKVIILGDAERLIVQEASKEAANSVLKVLEEPPEDTVIILTATSANKLLPTIRSRLIPVRFGIVADDEISAFLQEQRGVKEKDVARVAATIQGCPGLEVNANSGKGRESPAEDFLIAVTKGAANWSEQVLKQGTWDARGRFTEMLDHLSDRIRRKANAAAADQQDSVRRYVEAMRLVQRHRADAQGNLNPQASLAVLAIELEQLR